MARLKPEPVHEAPATSHEVQDVPEDGSSEERQSLNFETKVIPDAWEKTSKALLEAQEEIEGDEYKDAVADLYNLIDQKNPKHEKGSYSNGEEFTVEEIWGKIFDPDSCRKIGLAYRQTYREALTVLDEMLKEAQDHSNDEEKLRLKNQTLEIVAFLTTDEDDLEEFEDRFTEGQLTSLKALREDLLLPSHNFTIEFLDEGHDYSLPLEGEDFNSKLFKLQFERQKRRQNLIREFATFSGESTHEGRPLSETGESNIPDMEREIPPEIYEQVKAQIISRRSNNVAEGAPLNFKERAELQKRLEFAVWQETVDEQEGYIINTQGFTPGGNEQRDRRPGLLRIPGNKEVYAPQVFFMQKEYVRVPDTLTRSGNEELVEVNVSCSSFSEIKAYGDEIGLKVGESSRREEYFQSIFTFDSTANSVVKAQELLWQLDCHEKRNGFYMIPVVRAEKACWLPLTENQYRVWKRQLENTVKSFENVNLDYESVKQLQGAQVAESHRTRGSAYNLEVFSDVEDNREDAGEIWYGTHLQLAQLEKNFKSLNLAELSDDEKKRLTNWHSDIETTYLVFLSVYGRNSTYETLAWENLVSKGVDPDSSPDLLEAEIYRVYMQVEAAKKMLPRLSRSTNEVLSYLIGNPEKIPDGIGRLEELHKEFEENLAKFELEEVEQEAEAREETEPEFQGAVTPIEPEEINSIV